MIRCYHRSYLYLRTITLKQSASATALSDTETLDWFKSSPLAAFHPWLWKEPLSLPPLPCLSWQYLHQPFIPVFTCDKDRWVTVKMWQKLCAAVAMRTLRLLLVTLTLLVLESQGFELQDTIHALIEENIHLHDQLENLTKALRELKRMLWLHSNGTESSLCYL